MADDKEEESGHTVGDDLRAAFDEAGVGDEGLVEDEGTEEVEPEAESEADHVAQEEDGGEADAEPVEAEEPEEPRLTAPDRFSQADKEIFAELPRKAQERWIERENEFQKMHTERMRDIAPLRKAVEPWTNYLNSLNVPADQAFDTLLRYEAALRTGTPEQKRATLEGLARNYGIPLEQPADGASDDDFTDPRIAALDQRFGQLEQMLTQRQIAEQRSQLSEMERRLEEFREAKTDAGEPAHPFFADVIEDMIALSQAEQASGRSPVLEDLYERAVWMNPAVRERKLASQREAETRESTEEARRKAAEAKRRGKTVSGASAPQGSDPASSRSLREELESQF